MNSIVLRPGEGRSYPMGRISALFKADGDEPAGRYSISEWWLEPNTQGPGAHSHDAGDRAVVRRKPAEGRAIDGIIRRLQT